MRILKQLGRTSAKAGKEVEYAAAIALYLQMTGKTTKNTELALKSWIEYIGTSIASIAHPGNSKISPHRAGLGFTHKS
jgi:hypothetical protein